MMRFLKKTGGNDSDPGVARFFRTEYTTAVRSLVAMNEWYDIDFQAIAFRATDTCQSVAVISLYDHLDEAHWDANCLGSRAYQNHEVCAID